MKRLHGRAAVITGAGSGFGLEVASLAAAEGMHLVLADIDQAALDRIEAELRGLGAQTLAMRTDVADAGAVQRLADAAMKRFGPPGLVFNNAGIGIGGLIWENTLHDWERVVGVNVMGVAHGVRVFTPLMLEAARNNPEYEGHIVNTASMAGLQSAPILGIYNATKQAVVGLTETLYHDLALVTDRISASVLCPALVATGINRSDPNRSGTVGEAAPLTRSQQISRAIVEQGMASSSVSATDVAHLVMAAVRESRFYIFTHPKALRSVQARMEDMLQGRSPNDPFADMPGLNATLRNTLRSPE